MALDRPFLDDVHRFTYAPPKALRRLIGLEGELIRTRAELRRAHRFSIGDTTVELAARASLQTQRLPLWIRLARLPFEPMWIEFDQHVKMRALQQHSRFDEPVDLANVSRPYGVLLSPDSGSKTRWTAREFGLMVDKDTEEVMPNTLVHVIDPEGTQAVPVKGGMGRPNVSGEIAGTTEGIEYALMGFGGRAGDRLSIAIAPWYQHRVGAVLDPLYRLMLNAERERNGPRADARWASIVENYAIEYRGSQRVLIALMAALNEAPTETITTTPRPGRKTVRGREIPFLSYNVMRIVVPPVRVLPWLTRKLTEAYQRRRWHQVRGHWRRYRDETGAVSRSVWIASHFRGDTTVGVVTHDYAVTTRDALLDEVDE